MTIEFDGGIALFFKPLTLGYVQVNYEKIYETRLIYLTFLTTQLTA